tara:strand:+ start:1155 stop:1490 length:336 start_codon:yes stop_codon:yes gene_type:complete
MKNLKKLEQLQQLHQRLQNENTGSPIEMATYMNISERSIHNLIDELKILGAEICYSRTTKTYYYCNDFKIELNISLTVITEGTARNLYGGSYFLKENYFPARFLQGTKLCS